MKKSKFLTGDWRNLLMANYEIEPSLLLPLVPRGTELDMYEGRCYVSLVGFQFMNTRLKDVPVPFHRNFPEVNLRFYVKREEQGILKRGVVFVKEIVPLPTLSFIANVFYDEHYEFLKMRSSFEKVAGEIKVSYSWKKNGNWHSMQGLAASEAHLLKEGSEAEFIAEHYWGYTALASGKSSEYEVEHIPWKVHNIIEASIKVDFDSVYGEKFALLNDQEPVSVFLAEGSPIAVKSRRLF